MDDSVKMEESVKLVEAAYMRQLSVLPFATAQKARVTIIGAGAIGGFTAYALAKMGIGFLEVYDFDKVEIHNLPNQWFKKSDIGKMKVDCLKTNLEEYADIEISVHPDMYKAQRLQPIVITAVDSMTARIAIWEKIKENKKAKILIDARMGAQVGKIIIVDKDNAASVADYEKEELYPDAEAFQAPCTERSTIYCASGLGSFIASAVRSILVNGSVKQKATFDFHNWAIS